MREKAVQTLVFLGTENWLIDGLVCSGFRQTNTIITMQKTTFATPDVGSSKVVISQASEADFSTIVEIDRAAFEPVWRHTRQLLSRVFPDAAHFVVARLRDRTVGYAYASLIGRHGHIARIAVHPKQQGQRIGAHLLVELIRFFERKRAFGITLNTQQDNIRSRRLYEWFGFRLLGDEAYLLQREI
jgi:ribosomal protein S18 acetylase RimI-like enzyme